MQELIQSSGLTIKQFSEEYNIPYNTIRQWYNGERKCPDYLLSLLNEKIHQKKLNECKTIYLLVLNGKITYTYEDLDECKKWYSFCKYVSKYDSVKIIKGFTYYANIEKI